MVIVCAKCHFLVPDYAERCPRCAQSIGRPSPSLSEPSAVLGSRADADGSDLAPIDGADLDRYHEVARKPAGREPILVNPAGIPSQRVLVVDGSTSTTGARRADNAETESRVSKCPQCGAPASTGAWFCSCGAQLRATPAVAAESQIPRDISADPATSMMARRESRRQFDRAMRRENDDHRVGYDRPLSVHTTVFRMVLAVVVSGVLLALLLPSGASRRSSLYYDAEGLFRSTYEPIPLRDARALPGTQLTPPGFSAVGIASGRLQSAWAASWSSSEQQPIPARCQAHQGPSSDYLLVTFDKPTTVDRFVIQAGLDHSDPRWSELDRPALVDVLFDNGACDRFALADQFEAQTFDLHVRGVRNAEIRVVNVFAPTGVNPRVAAISSVGFMTRR